MDKLWIDGWVGGWKDGWMHGRVADTITVKHKLCIVFSISDSTCNSMYLYSLDMPPVPCLAVNKYIYKMVQQI